MSQLDIAAERALLLARMDEERRQLATPDPAAPPPAPTPVDGAQVARAARNVVVGLVAASGWPPFLKTPARAATSVWLRDRLAGLVRARVSPHRQHHRSDIMESTPTPAPTTPLNTSAAESRTRRGGARQLLDDLESTLRDSGHEDIEVLKTRLRAQLEDARDSLNDAGNSANELVRASVNCTEEYVRSHPWQAVGWAASAAFLLGVIVGRR
ncbi:MAG: hypothetical protein REJ50_26240 [Bordetella sp.]|nr:hypothetical protein [Bordetella sp.]